MPLHRGALWAAKRRSRGPSEVVVWRNVFIRPEVRLIAENTSRVCSRGERDVEGVDESNRAPNARDRRGSEAQPNSTFAVRQRGSRFATFGGYVEAMRFRTGRPPRGDPAAATRLGDDALRGATGRLIRNDLFDGGDSPTHRQSRVPSQWLDCPLFQAPRRHPEALFVPEVRERPRPGAGGEGRTEPAGHSESEERAGEGVASSERSTYQSGERGSAAGRNRECFGQCGLKSSRSRGCGRRPDHRGREPDLSRPTRTSRATGNVQSRCKGTSPEHALRARLSGLDLVSLVADLHLSKIHPPLFQMLGGFLMAFGGLRPSLSAAVSLAGWIGTVVLVFVVARRLAPFHPNSAGFVAALLAMRSPLLRAYATDVMWRAWGLSTYGFTLAPRRESPRPPGFCSLG